MADATVRLAAMAALACAGVIGVASASAWYVAPEGYLTFPDEYFQGEDRSLGFSFGRRLFRNFDVELGYSVNRFITEEEPTLFEQRNLQLNTIWTLGRIDAVEPYASLGFGAGEVEIAGEDEYRRYVSAGLGYTYALPAMRGLSLQNEVRGRFYVGDDKLSDELQSADTQVMLRLKYQPGASPRRQPLLVDAANADDTWILAETAAQPAVPVASATGLKQSCLGLVRGSSQYARLNCAALQDRDGDGIQDEFDLCSNTIPGVLVDQDGCMIGS